MVAIATYRNKLTRYKIFVSTANFQRKPLIIVLEGVGNGHYKELNAM